MWQRNDWEMNLIVAANKKIYITNLSKSSSAVTTYPYFAANTSTTPTGSSAFSTTSVNNVGVQPNTGTVLYVENRTPLSRYVEQIEDIRVIIQF
jgi:DNA-binding beta-propeller fold protein YncE